MSTPKLTHIDELLYFLSHYTQGLYQNGFDFHNSAHRNNILLSVEEMQELFNYAIENKLITIEKVEKPGTWVWQMGNSKIIPTIRGLWLSYVLINRREYYDITS